MKDLRFHDLKGAAKIEFRLPDSDQGVQGLNNGTVLLGGAKVEEVVPPHPMYEEMGAANDLYQMSLSFDAMGVDAGDLMADLEVALGCPAIIHGCHDLNSPETCYACSLLHRIRKVRQQAVPAEVSE